MFVLKKFSYIYRNFLKRFLGLFSILWLLIVTVTILQYKAFTIKATDYKDKNFAAYYKNLDDVVAKNNEKEKILNFLSDININPNTAEITITDNFSMNVLHKEVKHGLIINIPLSYKIKKSFGKLYKYHFKVLGVKIDNKPVPYKVSRIGYGVKIKIGDPNKIIPIGIHNFTLKYSVDRVLSMPKYANGQIEFYWNVNFTGFAINNLKARVHLFNGLDKNQIKYKVYTGNYGSTKASYMAFFKDNMLIFESTKPLDKLDYFTIAVLFPKGSIKNVKYTLIDQMKDNAGLFLSIVLLGVGIFIGIKFWQKVGKDPELGTIMPLFKPPKGLDVVHLRYLARLIVQVVDSKSLVAVLVQLAVKGFIKIKEAEKGKFELELIKMPNQDTWEYELLNVLFGDNKILAFYKEDKLILRKKILKALSILRKHVDTKKYFNNNFSTTIKLWLILYALFFISVLIAYFNYEITLAGLIALTSTGLMLNVVFVTSTIFLVNALEERFPYSWVVFGIVFAGIVNIFSGPFPWNVIFFFYTLVVYIFARLMPTFTKLGIQKKKEALGFKMFLEASEKDILNFLTPKELTPELFEKYLPYAIALGVENKWANKFKKVLSNLTKEEQENLTNWYVVSYNNSLYNFDINSLTNNLSSGLVKTLNTARTVEVSSSGGISGGFSGGFAGGGAGGGSASGW